MLVPRGDAREAAGDEAGAAEAYELVGAIAELYRANGVDVDLDLALFDADHRPGDGAVAEKKTYAGREIRRSPLSIAK